MHTMEQEIARHLDLLLERYPVLEPAKGEIVAAYRLMEACYANGGKLLIAGNGGSAADAEHMVGELMKSFRLPRRLPQDYVQKLASIDPDMG